VWSTLGTVKTAVKESRHSLRLVVYDADEGETKNGAPMTILTATDGQRKLLAERMNSDMVGVDCVTDVVKILIFQSKSTVQLNMYLTSEARKRIWGYFYFTSNLQMLCPHLCHSGGYNRARRLSRSGESSPINFLKRFSALDGSSSRYARITAKAALWFAGLARRKVRMFTGICYE